MVRFLGLCAVLAPTLQAQEPQTGAPSEEPGSYWTQDGLTGGWGGLRERWSAAGIVPGGGLVADWSAPWSGDASHHGTERMLLDLNLLLESKLLGFEGGSLYLDANLIEGRDGNRHLGSLLGVSSVDAPERRQISELWYEQFLLDHHLRCKFGKIDALSEFGFSELAGTFAETSASWSPTLLAQPTYPDSATGALLFVYPDDHWYGGFGIFDGATQDGFTTGTRGPSTFFSDSKSASWYSTGEVGCRFHPCECFGEGRIAAGFFHHTGRFDRFDGGTEHGTTGVFLIAEQQLWREADEEQGMAVSVRFGVADEDVAAVHQHVAIGLTYVGAIPGRDADTLGVLWNLGRTSRANGSTFTRDEQQFGVFYRAQLTPFCALQPDLQYFVAPGGGGQRDAFLGLLRLELTF
ncbi:MAG: carbohydrate porin [Planctomycetota bacterium]